MPLVSVLARLITVYVLLFILRVVFYLYNSDVFGVISVDELSDLFIGSLRFDTANICYTFGLFILFELAPVSVSIFKKKWFRSTAATLFYIGIVAVVVINLSDAIYFHFAKKRFSAEEFHFLTNGNNMQIMLRSAWENWYLVLTGLAMIVSSVFIYKATAPNPRPSRNKAIYYIGKVAIFALAVFLIIVGMRGGLSRATRPITLSNAAQYAQSPAKASIVLSNPFCLLRTIENKSLQVIRYFPDSTLSKIYSPLHLPADSSVMPSQKGKNVVIFVLESFSAEHSSVLNPGLYDRSIMPFLDSLMTQGLYFTQAYANGAKSIDALPAILSSIPSLGLPFATMPAALSPMDGLGSMLDSLGYSTWFFNGSQSGSMGYAAYARLGGVQQFRSRENYEAARGKNDFDGYWGIWDGPFLQYFGAELTAIPQPFFASLFTLTSHHPFVIPAKYEGQFLEGRTKVHRCVEYVDMAFRDFFDYAKRQAWYDNTLFVFVADHVSSERFDPVTSTPTAGAHIVYFIYTPDGSLRGKSEQITQQIDIKPTLLGLMRNKKPYHAFGRDLFSTENSVPPFAVNFSGELYQWIEGDTAYFFDKYRVSTAYNYRRDSLEKINIASGVDSLPVNRLKAFLQSYHEAISAKSFTYSQKK